MLGKAQESFGCFSECATTSACFVLLRGMVALDCVCFGFITAVLSATCPFALESAVTVPCWRASWAKDTLKHNQNNHTTCNNNNDNSNTRGDGNTANDNDDADNDNTNNDNNNEKHPQQE